MTAGFDFLGFDGRHYPVSNTRTGDKLLIKPSQESVKKIKHRLKQEGRRLLGYKLQAVIQNLNPMLRGWGHSFRPNVAKETFRGLDHWLFQREIRWCRRPHERQFGPRFKPGQVPTRNSLVSQTPPTETMVLAQENLLRTTTEGESRQGSLRRRRRPTSEMGMATHQEAHHGQIRQLP